MALSRASAVREGGGEASAGVVQARLLSRGIGEVRGADEAFSLKEDPLSTSACWSASAIEPRHRPAGRGARAALAPRARAPARDRTADPTACTARKCG